MIIIWLGIIRTKARSLGRISYCDTVRFRIYQCQEEYVLGLHRLALGFHLAEFPSVIQLGICLMVLRLGIIRTGCSWSIGTVTDYGLLSIIILRQGEYVRLYQTLRRLDPKTRSR